MADLKTVKIQLTDPSLASSFYKDILPFCNYLSVLKIKLHPTRYPISIDFEKIAQLKLVELFS